MPIFKLNMHNQKLLKMIQEFCKEYLEGKINLSTLQSSVNAVHSNFENDVDKTLRNKIFYFVEELEGIRFCYSDEKHFNLVSDEIEHLDSAINTAIAGIEGYDAPNNKPQSIRQTSMEGDYGTKCLCCFCGKDIESDKFNPCDLIIGTNWDNPKDQQHSQFFWCHIECFREKLHDSVKMHFLLHLIDTKNSEK